MAEFTSNFELVNNKHATRQLLRQHFPIFLAEAFITFSVAGIMLTMVELSHIIFAEPTFRSIEISFLITARTWSVAIMGLVFGIFSDRLRRKSIFIIILIIAGLGRFLNGFAPESPDARYGFFLFCNILVGFGQGGLQPTVASYCNDAVDHELRSRFFGIYEIFRQVFQISGMILASFMFQIGLWREYFWVTGIMLFICVGLVWSVIKEPKRGSAENALKAVLAIESIQYKYRLNKDTVKKTMFSPSNVLAFFEGIFTWIIFSIGLFLMYPYVQSPPYNISAFATSILTIMFGMPGAIIGSIVFARLSDRLAQKDIMARVNLIVFSIFTLFIALIIIFLVPIPHISAEQGKNVGFLITQWGFLGFGILLFIIRGVLSIYHINQSPILQKINLPEAQGTVSAYNQFLETIGMGIGPVLAGYLLTVFNGNYLYTAIISLLVGLPSALFWLLIRRWIHRDIANIDVILQQRASELAKNNSIK